MKGRVAKAIEADLHPELNKTMEMPGTYVDMNSDELSYSGGANWKVLGEIAALCVVASLVGTGACQGFESTAASTSASILKTGLKDIKVVDATTSGMAKLPSLN